MKFLLELMACCGCSSGLPPPEDIGPLVPAATAPPTNRKSRRRRRGAPLRCGDSVDNWRPSLSAISEDNAQAPRSVKRKVVSAASPPSTQPRHRRDDTRRVPFTALAPAFSPTPFLF